MSKARKSKKFKYQLYNVLKVRKIRERQEQDRFNTAKKKVIKEKQKEDELKLDQTLHYEELLSMMGDELPDMNVIQMRKLHLERLKQKVDEQVEVRKTAESERDLQRDVLTEAVKKKKVIEKDEEKTKKSWKKLMDKENGKFLDEIAVIGFDKKKKEGSQ